MKVTPLELKGLMLIEPVIFTDERGYFFESFNEERFGNSGIDLNFVQDNHSLSSKGVLRGLHFQKAPFEQGKLVRVAQGAVLDVVVDIRKQSPIMVKACP
jgi:dTDP-4-dehydrorhamnose 3,5-epimerase